MRNEKSTAKACGVVESLILEADQMSGREQKGKEQKSIKGEYFGIICDYCNAWEIMGTIDKATKKELIQKAFNKLVK